MKPLVRCPPGVAFALAACAVLASAPAHAQRYGQWSWTGGVGVGQRSYQNENGDGKQTYGEKELRLSLGLNGFVLSPAVAGFRIGADALFLRVSDPASRNNFQWGGRGDLSILPQGSVPIRLYAGHSRYEFGEEQSSPVYSSGTPDSGTTAGGRIRIRRGPLAGLFAGYDLSRLSFVEPDTPPQTRGIGFVDWVAPIPRFQPHFRLERRDEEYGQAGYSFRDWVAGYDHRGPVLGPWTWQLSASGLDRKSSFDLIPDSSTWTARVQSNLSRPSGSRGSLSIDYGLGYARVAEAASSVTHAGTVRYLVGLGHGFTAGSSVTWAAARSAGYSSDGPIANLNAGWNGSAGPWSFMVNAGGEYLWQEQSSNGIETRSNGWGGSAGLTISHQSRSGLREELSVSAAKNELKPANMLDSGLPDPGWSIPVARAEDRATARATISAPFGTVRTSLWGEVERRDSSEGFQTPVSYRLERETLSASVQGGRVGLTANAGNSRVKNGMDQEVRFLGASLSLRPAAWLHVGGSFRLDRRHLSFSPDIDAWRGETLVGLSVGAFRLTGTGFLTEETVADGSRRKNRGFSWSLSRGFDGWLPFISAPVRRGVVK